MNGVSVLVDIKKEDVELLTQVMQETENEDLRDFIIKVLKNTDDMTADMIASAEKIAASNPFSICRKD